MISLTVFLLFSSLLNDISHSFNNSLNSLSNLLLMLLNSLFRNLSSLTLLLLFFNLLNLSLSYLLNNWFNITTRDCLMIFSNYKSSYRDFFSSSNTSILVFRSILSDKLCSSINGISSITHHINNLYHR